MEESQIFTLCDEEKERERGREGEQVGREYYIICVGFEPQCELLGCYLIEICVCMWGKRRLIDDFYMCILNCWFVC